VDQGSEGGLWDVGEPTMSDELRKAIIAKAVFELSEGLWLLAVWLARRGNFAPGARVPDEAVEHFARSAMLQDVLRTR